jgi:hypothetical protein
MSVVNLADIGTVLRRFENRYRWLDVFVQDVRELQQGNHRIQQIGENLYRAQLDDGALDLQVYPDRGVARFSLARGPDLGPMLGLAALGAILGVAARPKGPEGLVLGVLVGGLMGAAVADRRADPDENRIMTLRFEPSDGWKVYAGPYRGWAKEALSPG